MMNLEKELITLKYKICLLENQCGNCIDVVFNFAEIVVVGGKRKFIYVIQDEINNNDSSLYIYTGVELKFLMTVPVI
jgi:hypothetical protein